ncbi:MAG: hypothetical protein BZ138_04340 [Methanosphaera sp. rholeuAM270]|nr:MAG: hypothetical protein BZ138_04340 [Methanosphaera sp. rholeuAM270]
MILGTHNLLIIIAFVFNKQHILLVSPGSIMCKNKIYGVSDESIFGHLESISNIDGLYNWAWTVPIKIKKIQDYLKTLQ